VSKDEDFFKYFILKGQPPKLLMITMSNIVNKDLIVIFKKNIDQIETDLEQNKVVEFGNDTVTVHF
jgi:predicted nuclease of predicted toxin-antitoxin system